MDLFINLHILLIMLIARWSCRTLAIKNSVRAEKTNSESHSNDDNIDFNAAMAKFALSVLKQSKSDQNVFFSPLSMVSCLGMAYAGAGGRTEHEINRLLFNGMRKNLVYQQIEMMTSLLRNVSSSSTNGNGGVAEKGGGGGGGVTFKSATGAFIQKSFFVLQKYVEVLKRVFYGQMYSVDFVGQPELTSRNINGWLYNKTDRKIKGVFGFDSFDKTTRLVLLSAVYFKGDWSSRFKETETTVVNFHGKGTTKFPVRMMRHKGSHFYYLSTDREEILGVPYAQDEFVFYILLPSRHVTLGQYESTLDNKRLLAVVQNATKKDTKVAIPKFKQSAVFDMEQLMTKTLGLREMFSAEADFSGINGRRDLHVSKAIHSAQIDVNEKGSEAAGSTSLTLMFRSAGDQHENVFIADRPFLYAIFHRPGWRLLFLGRFARPVDSTDGKV